MASAAAAVSSSEDRISKRNFDQLARFIYDYSGIKMPPSKITMLEGRLRRRLRATGISSFDGYCDYLFKHDGLESEKVYLIDAVTTNKTDFFREPNHFSYLASHVLPGLASRNLRRIRAWSAACSTGAEPYTMAMVIDDFIGSDRQTDYMILATDLSTDVLQVAQRGIYSADMVAPVPDDFQARYVRRAVNPQRSDVRISPALRSKVGFARLNLMDAGYSVGEPMHFIFCRNVLIYFDKPTQQRVLSRLVECLEPGGHLFIGHSETVSGFDLPIRQVANTVFQKT